MKRICVYISLLYLTCLELVTASGLAMKMHRRTPHEFVEKRDIATVSLYEGYPGNYPDYWVNVTVGTPPQTLQLSVTMGDDSTWLYGPGSCNSTCDGGIFYSNASSTYTELAPGNFSRIYIDGSHIEADFISDDLTMGGFTIKNLTMGVASATSGQGSGVLGIGLKTEQLLLNNTFTYPDILDGMIGQGLIDTRLYSVWFEGDEGNLLFGAIDTTKFAGDLTRIPIRPSTNFYGGLNLTSVSTSYVVNDTTIGIDFKSTSFPAEASIGLGTPSIYLPSDIFLFLTTFFSTFDIPDFGLGVNCSLADPSQYLVLGLSDAAKIPIPYPDFLIPILNTDGTQYEHDGVPGCLFNIQDAGTAGASLGNSFMRSAYVVFDVDSNEVGIAPVIRSTDSDIEVVSLGTTSLTPFAGGSSTITLPSSTSTIRIVISTRTSTSTSLSTTVVTEPASSSTLPPTTSAAPMPSGLGSITSGVLITSTPTKAETTSSTPTLSTAGTTTSPSSAAVAKPITGVTGGVQFLVVPVAVLMGSFVL